MLRLDYGPAVLDAPVGEHVQPRLAISEGSGHPLRVMLRERGAKLQTSSLWESEQKFEALF